MIDVAGHTQTQLAEQVGVTQGLVSQRLRLLDLPDVWQERIISGLISASWTRCLLPWLERPAVLERASEAMKTIGGNREVSERDVEQSVYNAMTELSRPLRGGFFDDQRQRYVKVAFRPGKKQLAELDVVEVQRYHQSGEARVQRQALEQAPGRGVEASG